MDKEDTIHFIRSLITSTNGTYLLSQLLEDFYNETGYKLPSFGYKTTLDFLKSIPNILKLTGTHNDIQVKAVEGLKSAHIASLIQRQNKTKKGKRIKINVGDKCMKYMTFEANIWNEYRLDQHEVLKSKKAVEAPDSTHNNEQLGFIKSVELPHPLRKMAIKNELKTLDDEINIVCPRELKESLCTDKKENLFGNDILTELDDLPKVQIKSYVKVGKYIEVCISNVCNPDEFSLQLRRYKIMLVNLMVQMQDFYMRNAENYKIPMSAIKTNQLCAALYKKSTDSFKWHRAMIVRHCKKSTVVISLIDYGAETEIEINKLRFLHRQFGVLPRQALMGRLANLRPVQGKNWPKYTNKRFSELVLGRDLVAGVVDVNYEDLCLSLALSCTHGKDIHINDTLVEENLAILKSDDLYVERCLWLLENDSARNNAVISNEITNSAHPKEINETGKLSSQIEKQMSNGKCLSYSERNDRLKEMFSQYVTVT